MTVSDQIIEVLNALCEKFGIALDWGNENVIPYVMTLGEKLVNYGIWSSAAWIVISIVGIVVSIKIIKQTNWDDLFDDFDIGGGVLCVLAYAICLLSVIAIIGNIFDIIKCLTFPELYIFEYIQNLINSGS